MVFQAKVKWYDANNNIEREETCIIYSSPDSIKSYAFSDAVTQLEDYYGEDLCHISEIKIISDNKFLVIDGHKDVANEGDITV